MKIDIISDNGLGKVSRMTVTGTPNVEEGTISTTFEFDPPLGGSNHDHTDPLGVQQAVCEYLFKGEVVETDPNAP